MTEIKNSMTEIKKGITEMKNSMTEKYFFTAFLHFLPING
jgi:hypothetical protein